MVGKGSPVSIQKLLVPSKLPHSRHDGMVKCAGAFHITAPSKIAVKILYGRFKDRTHIENAVIVAVPAVYGRHFPVRNLDQRISFCHLQAVVHYFRIIGFLQLP